MKRVVVVAGLIAVLSVVASAQAASGRSPQSGMPEQEIVSLSRQYVDETILIGHGETLDIHDIRVRISGNTARFTSRADKRGQEASGRAYTHPHRLTVEYVRREGRWQVVRGQWGKVTR